MRILHITPEVPGRKSGGQCCVLQSLKMLEDDTNQIDYIGPEISDIDIRNCYENLYELESSHSLFEIIYTVCNFQLNKRFAAWKKVIKNFDLYLYDYIYIDFTKQDYAVKDIRKKNPDIQIFVRAHNVEYDFSKNDYASTKKFKELMISILAKKHEEYILKNVNKVFTLTYNDLTRFCDIYDVSKSKMSVIPICINAAPNVNLEDHALDSKVHLLITGSLWYGVNLDGIMWLIKEVLPLIKCDYELMIAGSRPSDNLKQICKEKGIILIDSPESMADYLEWCDVVLVPVFSGAGMKVKIAEALSYARPVVTTTFGAIGYDISNGEDSFIADNPEEFGDCIMRFSKMSHVGKRNMMRKAKALFDVKYDIRQGKFLFKKYSI